MSNIETVDDILAEARLINPHNEWADRIEAAHKREVAEAEARGLETGAICEAERATDPNIRLVERELAAAKVKHPKFCDQMTYLEHFSRSRWAQSVAALHAQNKLSASLACLSAHSVLVEELFEALEQHALGNCQAARVEWAQVAAVAVRAMEMCEKGESHD